MKTIRKALLWLLMLNKRLFRKPVFLVILALIPLLVFGYQAATREESGVLTIALAQEGEDPLAAQVIDDLMDSSQLLRFRLCQSPLEAEDQVRSGKADCAWIFPDALQQRIEAFVSDPSAENAFVRVLERESNVMLMLTREKLSGALYELCAPTVYRNFLRQNIPEMAQASDAELMAYYNGTGITDALFVFEQAGGSAAEQDTNFLLAPVRGLLAVVIVICGIAASMYFVQDMEKGTFAWVPARYRLLTELGCQIVAVMDVCIASLLSLAVAGLTGSILRELLALVLYSLCASAFCMLLRRLCGTVRTLGTLLPLLAVVMLVVCPVFFDLGALREFQYLFPPTYYIHAVYADRYFLYMLLYTLAAATAYLLIGKVFRRN